MYSAAEEVSVGDPGGARAHSLAYHYQADEAGNCIAAY